MSQQQPPESVPLAGEMPMLGLGTWQNDQHDQCVQSVRTALDRGYRHVDTAQAYGNEAAVGAGIDEAGVDRDEVFLATKLWIDTLSHDDVIESARGSLDRLGTDYVDLLYVHWPSGDYDPEGTLSAFDELYDEDAIRHVGVSNFEPQHLDTAREVLDAPLFANQVEMHPLLQQDELREYADANDLELVAYSPLARGDAFDVDELTEIAEKHDASEAQIALTWLREKGVTAIPKATGENHIVDNWRSLGVNLDADDVAAIDAIDREARQVNPDFAPDTW